MINNSASTGGSTEERNGQFEAGDDTIETLVPTNKTNTTSTTSTTSGATTTKQAASTCIMSSVAVMAGVVAFDVL